MQRASVLLRSLDARFSGSVCGINEDPMGSQGEAHSVDLTVPNPNPNPPHECCYSRPCNCSEIRVISKGRFRYVGEILAHNFTEFTKIIVGSLEEDCISWMSFPVKQPNSI